MPVQKEIYINTEVLGIVNSEIVKVTDENVLKEIDINREVLGIVNRCYKQFRFFYILINNYGILLVYGLNFEEVCEYFLLSFRQNDNRLMMGPTSRRKSTSQ